MGVPRNHHDFMLLLRRWGPRIGVEGRHRGHGSGDWAAQLLADLHVLPLVVLVLLVVGRDVVGVVGVIDAEYFPASPL